MTVDQDTYVALVMVETTCHPAGHRIFPLVPTDGEIILDRLVDRGLLVREAVGSYRLTADGKGALASYEGPRNVSPPPTTQDVWSRLLAAVDILDERDITDDAHRFADHEVSKNGSLTPEERGERLALASIAFDAGVMFTKLARNAK